MNFVWGEFSSSDSKKTFSKISAFDGSILTEVSLSEPLDVIKALQGAKKAAQAFRELPIEERAQFLLKMAQHFEDHADQIAFDEALHQGLSHSFVLENSVQFSIKLLRQVAKEALHFSSADTLVQATGVVGIITSWGCSLRLIIERMAPALAAGNVVLIKVSEQSPISAKIIGEAVQAAQVPAGVVNILQGPADIGQLIAGHPGIRAITAAGRTSTMESIAKTGLAQFKKLQLSGSAKNPSIVLNDSDFENRMADILKPFLMGQGQLCWNTSRIFVLESFAPAFLEAAKTYLANLEQLKEPRGRGAWTPLISEPSLQQIHTKVQEGASEQGKVIAGGSKDATTGFFYKPTVMLDLSNCSVLQQDELQGPLLLITPVKYQHEAVKWANTSYLAHSGIVWGLPEKVLKVATQMEVAHVWLNSWMHSGNDNKLQTIFGHKQSSFGNLDMAWSGSFYSDVKKLAGK